MDQSFSLEALLRQAGERMRLDLRERLIPHPGELGTDREEVIRGFLRAYLPRRFDVSTGFAFDASGDVSRQLDIVIADASTCPRFETAGKKQFYPCESVVSVGQVKSSITSVKEFREALTNLQSAKVLDRSAGGRALDWRTGELIDQRSNHLHQVFTFLFVTGEMLIEDVVRDELIEYIQETEAHVWPNVIIALDRYLTTYCCDDGVCPNPMHARGIAFQKHSSKHDILMQFYLLLGRAVEVTSVSHMPYGEYLRHIHHFDAEVWYSCADSPPPFLSSL